MYQNEIKEQSSTVLQWFKKHQASQKYQEVEHGVAGGLDSMVVPKNNNNHHNNNKNTTKNKIVWM